MSCPSRWRRRGRLDQLRDLLRCGHVWHQCTWRDPHHALRHLCRCGDKFRWSPLAHVRDVKR